MSKYNSVREYILVLIFIWILALVLLTVDGCAAGEEELTDVEKQERAEIRKLVDAENWMYCKAAYERAGSYTIHYDHMHRDGRVYGLSEERAIRRDLIDNNCRAILQDYWIPYPWAE